MIYKFTEVLNDLRDCFLLGDILLLEQWKNTNGLSDDLASEFTSNVSGDNVALEGIMHFMTGIVNYPYTIIFNLSGDKPELLKEGNRLQVRQGGYSLKVENNVLLLFTWPILTRFSNENISALIESYKNQQNTSPHALISGGLHSLPYIEIENGWYSIEILGGETLQSHEVKNVKTGEMVQVSNFDPTFEFVLKKTEKQVVEKFDIDFSFKISSSTY